MIKGEKTEISPVGQELLATWALKTALMCQLMQDASVRNLPPSHYKELFQDRKPSRQMRVFAAYMRSPRYEPGVSPLEYRSIPSEASFHAPDGAAHKLWGVVVTLRIGYAVLQLMCVGPVGYNYEVKPAGFAPYARQIWPARDTTSWPPQPLESIDELDQFADPLKSPKVVL
ncbi:hypothetical protein [Streptomyces sp. NPDC058142]|uniref:hypothetical protein n=1 Tax=Streptomyces sp. NPDC058142 TaxID=3346355 RepID=UPI0036E72A7F